MRSGARISVHRLPQIGLLRFLALWLSVSAPQAGLGGTLLPGVVERYL